MNEKTVMFASLIAVLVISAIGLVGISRGNTTGNAVTPRNQCCCEISHYDFYGNQVGREIYPLRVKSLSTCPNACELHFGHVTRRDVLSSEPC